MYTLGNITSLCSSGFLFGPRRQLRVMRKAKRRIAVGVYLGLMVLTLTVARGSSAHQRVEYVMVRPVERSAVRNAAPRSPSGLLGALISACPVARGLKTMDTNTRRQW